MAVRGRRSIADTFVSILPETARVAAAIARAFKDVDPEAKAAARRWRDEMTRELGQVDARLHVDLDAAQARADAERLRRHVEGMRPTVRVDVDSNGLDGLGASIASQIADALRGGGRGPGGGAAGIANVGSGASSGASGAANPAMIAGLVGLAGIASSTAGAIGLIPAAAVGAGAAVGTLALAFDGFGDAMKNIKDPEKFAESLGQLAPNAQAVATAIQGLMPAFDTLKMTVSDAFFAPLTNAIVPLVTTYLPMVQTGLSQMGSVMGNALGGLAQFMQTPEMLGFAGEMTNNLVTAFSTFSGVLNPVVGALTQIGAVGSSFLPQIAQSAVQAANAFSQFINQAAQSGQLGQWIQTGIDSLGQIMDIAGSLGQVFAGLAPLGSALLPALSAIVSGLTPGLVALGGVLGTLVSAAAPLLSFIAELASSVVAALAPALQTLLGALGPVIQQLVSALGPVVQAITPVLGELASILAEGLSKTLAIIGPLFGELVGVLGRLLQALLPILPPIMDFAMSILPALASVLSGVVVPIITTLAGWLADLANVIIPPLASVIKQLAEWFRIGFDAIKTVVSRVWEFIKPIFEWIDRGIRNIINNLHNLPVVGKLFAPNMNGGGGSFDVPGTGGGMPGVSVPGMTTVIPGAPGASGGSINYKQLYGQVDPSKQVPADFVGPLAPGYTRAPAASPFTPSSAVAVPPVSTYTPPPPASSSGKSGGSSFEASAPAPAATAGLADESHLKGDAVLVNRYLTENYPQLTEIGGWRASDPYPDHPSGKALDVMIPNWDTAEGKALGDRILSDLMANSTELGIDSAIWRQTYYPVGGTPNKMEDRGSANENHMNHVHVLTKGASAAGGALPMSDPGMLPATAGYGGGLTGASSKQLRDAQQRVDDRERDIRRAEARLNDLDRKDKVSPKEREEAEHRLAKAKREHADAIDDLAAAQQKYNEKQGKSKKGGGSDFESMGRDLMGGVAEFFGFDGSVFSNPADFGLLKLLGGITKLPFGEDAEGRGGAGGGGGEGGLGGLLSFVPKGFGDLNLGSPKDAPVPYMGGLPGYNEGSTMLPGMQFVPGAQAAHGQQAAQGGTPGPGNTNDMSINFYGPVGNPSAASQEATNMNVPRARQAARQGP